MKKNRLFADVACLGLLMFSWGCQKGILLEPSVILSPTPTHTPSAPVTLTVVPSFSPTDTPTQPVSVTPTPPPPTYTRTRTFTPVPSFTPTITSTRPVTLTLTPTPTPWVSSTSPTPTKTQTVCFTCDDFICLSCTLTPTRTATPLTTTPTWTPSFTTPTKTPTKTFTCPCLTPSVTVTSTPSITQTACLTCDDWVGILTRTPTPTPAITLTWTPSATPDPGSCGATIQWGDSIASASAVTVLAGQTYAQRYNLAQDSTAKKIWIQPLMASILKVGIYTGSSTYNWPTNRVYVSSAVTVATGLNPISIPDVPLTAGTYWLAYEPMVSTVLRGASSSSAERDMVWLDFPAYWLQCGASPVTPTFTPIYTPTPAPICTPPPYTFTNQVVLYAELCY